MMTGVRRFPLADSEGALCTNVCPHTNPQRTGQRGPGSSEMQSTYTNTLPMRCSVQKREDRSTPAMLVSLMKCSSILVSREPRTCSDQNVDFITESFFFIVFHY